MADLVYDIIRFEVIYVKAVCSLPHFLIIFMLTLDRLSALKTPGMKNKPLLATAVLLCLSAACAYSQDHYTGQNLTVAQCLTEAERYRQRGDLKEATRYLNTAAMQVWENRRYQDAINYFQQSIQLNEQLRNESGIAKLHSNLGMIYADMAEYETSLSYFQRALDYRLKYGEKSEIISTYINKSVVLNNLKQYNDAAGQLESALALATEMNDAAQMKSCYGMLAETYEKAGNQERTLHYFNLYRTFHEMVQRQKVAEANQQTEAAQLKALQADLLRKDQELALARTSRELQLTEEELKKMDGRMRSLLESQTKQELAMNLLEQERELDKLLIAKAESARSEQTMWTILSAGSLGVAVLVTLMLYRNYRFKKKVNLQLSEQYEEIRTLNENLESQVQKRTAELRKALVRLENRNRDLDQFSHVISHNLRGPVARILGLGKVIDRQDMNNPVNLEVFNRLIGAAQDLDTVVTDLSTILYVKDNQSLPQECVPLTNLITASTTILKTELEQSGLVIHVDHPERDVCGVKAYLESAMFNLLSNAIKYAQPGRKPEVWVSVSHEDQQCVLTLRDNGMGMRAEDYPKIFEPYKRLNLDTPGKGLGLYMVKTQVEAMGGTIRVSSEEGRGSVFTIVLPESIVATTPISS